MKLNYALHGSNLNPSYYEFWPVVSKVWQKMNVTPVLALVTPEVTEATKTRDEHGIVIKLPELNPDISGNLAQLGRMYVSKFLNGNCILSDIDLIPVDFSYFKMCSNYITPTNIVYPSADHPQGTHMFPSLSTTDFKEIRQIVMAYILGHSNTFNKVFSTHLNWVEWIKLCTKTPLEKDIPTKINWWADQNFTTRTILQNSPEIFDPKIDLKLLRRVDYTHSPEQFKFDSNGKISSSLWEYSRINRGERDIEAIKSAVKNHKQSPIQNRYIDCHFRPYSPHKEIIDKFVEAIIEQQI